MHTTTHQNHHWQRNFTKWDCFKNTTTLRKIQIYSSPSPTKYSFGKRSTMNGCQLCDKPYFVGNHVICCSHTGKYMFGVKGVLLTMGRIRTYGHSTFPVTILNSELFFSQKFYIQCPYFPCSENLNPHLLLRGRWFPSFTLQLLRPI